MPNTIKVKRGKSAALNTSTEKLQAGEALYNLDKNYLTVGAKDNDALTKKPVAAREIVGYTGDTDAKIGASTTEAYSIRYDNNSGVVVRSENNILSTPDTIKMQARGKEGNTLAINTGEVYTDAADNPTIEISSIHGGTQTLTIPRKTGTLATTDDITTSAATKLDNTNEDKVALKNNKSLSYTSEATASTLMSRDVNGRAKVADGAADQDIATVGQLNTGLNTKVTKPANPAADSVLSILKDGSIGSIPQIKYITLTGSSGTLTADQLSTLNENIKYNFIIKETKQAGGYVNSRIFRPIQVYNELDEDVDFVYAHIELDISELIGISGNSWYYSSWKLSNDKVVEISSVDADSGTLTTQQNNDLLDRRTLLLLHGEYYYFIGDLTHAETKIFNSYVSYGKGANDSLQIKIVTIDENTSPNTWVRTTYDLGNYYTKTQSDERYVKQSTSTSGTVVYGRKAGAESVIEASYSAVANSIPYRDSYGTLQVNNPVNILDAVNKQYGDSKYFNKAEIELTPTTGDTISKEQLQDLDTGLYAIFGHKIYGLDNSGYFNIEIFHSAGHRTYLLESSNNDVYTAQILNDTDRTFTGWVQVATTSYVDNGFVKQTTEVNKVYATDSTGTDSELGYSQSPANSAITQYTSSGTVRTNDPINNLDAVNRLYLEFNAPSLKSYCGIIPSDGNANSYTSAGTYVCDAYSTTLVNFPTEFNAGRLFVLYGTQASEYPIQIAIPYNSSSLYVRNRFENNWSAWSTLATTAYVDNKTIGKLDKTGGTITGSLTIAQNLIVNGTTSTVESTSLKVKDKLIYVAKDNTVALTTPAGIITPKYDGTNNGGIVYDSTGTAFVGDIVLDSNGNVDVANSDLQPIATRNDYSAYTTDHIITASVDSAGKSVKFIDSGKTLNDITSKIFSVTIYEAGE